MLVYQREHLTSENWNGMKVYFLMLSEKYFPVWRVLLHILSYIILAKPQIYKVDFIFPKFDRNPDSG